ncbi:SGNH/GDSL hydrolase family protein [Engelhardtia mirabilis]
MTDRPTPSKARRALLVSSISLAVMVLGSELLLRVVGFSNEEPDPVYAVWGNELDAQMKSGRGLHQITIGTLWEPRPGAEIPMAPGEFVNSAGFRGPEREVAKPDGVVRVLTLGDSSSFGMKVAYDECYTAQLEQNLRGAGLDAETIAGGVIGYTIAQGLERFRKLSVYSPDVVVLAFGAVNELYPAQGLPDRPKIAHQKGVGFSKTDVLRANSKLVQLAHYVRDDLLGGREADRIAKYEAWVKAEQHVGGQGALDWPGTRRVAPEDFGAYLDEFVGEIRAAGAIPVLLSMPRQRVYEVESPFCLKYTKQLEAAAERLDVPLVDGRDLFKWDEVERPDPDQLFLDHFHPSAEGHQILAGGLAPVVLEALAGTRD